jgi:hypothetical protein
LPRRSPEGWSIPVAPRNGATWRVVVDDVLVLAWVHLEPYGPQFFVAMMHPGREEEVPHNRAIEILAHFREVTEFVECEEVPSGITNRAARCWMALPVELLDIVYAAPKLPRPVEPPVHEHLGAVRKHLPEKLPFGWSPFIAAREAPDTWMIRDDDLFIIVSLCTTSKGIKLHVGIIGNPEEPPDETRVADVLQHFRGVREFLETAADGPIRTFLGEIGGGGEAREQLN